MQKATVAIFNSSSVMWSNLNSWMILISLDGNDMWKTLPQDNLQSLVEIVMHGMCVIESEDW